MLASKPVQNLELSLSERINGKFEFSKDVLMQVSCHAILKTPLCCVWKTQKPWTGGFDLQKSFHAPPQVSPEIQRLRTTGQLPRVPTNHSLLITCQHYDVTSKSTPNGDLFVSLFCGFYCDTSS